MQSCTPPQAQREKQRATLLESQGELRSLWAQHYIDGPLLLLLQDIFLEQGEDAAHEATKAALLYVREELARQ